MGVKYILMSEFALSGMREDCALYSKRKAGSPGLVLKSRDDMKFFLFIQDKRLSI